MVFGLNEFLQAILLGLSFHFEHLLSYSLHVVVLVLLYFGLDLPFLDLNFQSLTFCFRLLLLYLRTGLHGMLLGRLGEAILENRLLALDEVELFDTSGHHHLDQLLDPLSLNLVYVQLSTEVLEVVHHRLAKVGAKEW